ncbi:MAG TPA: galactosyltransferase-related protein [Trueperaceae bacterium]
MTSGGAGPALSVITASRGRHELLLRKAASLAAQTLPPSEFEWRLWLNEPPEDVAVVREALEALALPFAVWVGGGSDEPVGRARDLAAEGARGRVLLLSDDDCLPAPGALAAHLAFHDATPRAVGVGPLRLPPELRRGRRAEPFERPAALGRRAWWFNLTGANSSLPAAAFRAVGGYDPAWRDYGGEDPELALRLRDAGLRFRHVPGGDAYHHGRVWDDERKAYLAGRAHVRVWRRHQRPDVALALGVHPWLLALKRAALGGPWARLLDPDVRRYELAYARGARDELRGAAPRSAAVTR